MARGVAMFRPLDARDLERIHEASLRILERVGMVMEHGAAQDVLAAAGASVDRATGVVRFPSDVVESALALVPRRIAYHGRSPEFDFVCEPRGDIHSEIGGGSFGYIDLVTGEHRPARVADLREFSIIADALQNTHVAAAHICDDVPPATADLHCLRVLLESQRLPISTSAFNARNLRWMVEMLLTAQGDSASLAERPRLQLELSPISPLYFPRDEAEQLFLACEYGIPIQFPVMPNTGATGPMTLAGTLAQANAEWLGLVTLTESVRPGHPVPYFIDPVVADMHSVSARFAAPEAVLLMATHAQLAVERYGLAAQDNGTCSDGFSYAQTMFQKAQNALAFTLAGGSLLVGNGEIAGVTAFDPVQLVIDDEITGLARRWVRPMTVDDDTLAIDVLESVGPRGHFLDTEHTLKHLRSGELLPVELFERGSRASWSMAGSRSIVDAARQKALQILASHEIPPLDEPVLRELGSLQTRADADCA